MLNLKELEQRLDFSRVGDEPIQLNFVYRGNKYILKEVFGDGHIAYQNAIEAARLRDTEGRFAGWKNLHDVDLLLISKCLIRITSEGAYESVAPDELRGWEQRVLRPILKTIREISEMDEEPTEEELLKEKERIEKLLALRKTGGAVKNGQTLSGTGSS